MNLYDCIENFTDKVTRTSYSLYTMKTCLLNCVPHFYELKVSWINHLIANELRCVDYASPEWTLQRVGRLQRGESIWVFSFIFVDVVFQFKKKYNSTTFNNNIRSVITDIDFSISFHIIWITGTTIHWVRGCLSRGHRATRRTMELVNVLDCVYWFDVNLYSC